MKRAVFLDRDGTITREVGYLADPDALEFIPGVAEAIAMLNHNEWLSIVVTNQSGTGRGYFTRESVERVHHRMQHMLSKEGAFLDAIYYCPHRPEDGCDCRKPRIGLLRQAVADFGIELSHSYVVGDKLSDMEMGRRAGCNTALVLTGYGKESENEAGHVSFVAPDLRAAVDWIVRQGKYL